jgi:hypothetical protein
MTISGLNYDWLNRRTGFFVDNLNWLSTWTKLPSVAPLHHRNKHWKQFATPLRQLIVMSFNVGPSRYPSQNSLVNQDLQPIGQNCFCDTKPALKIRERRESVERVTKDQQGPLVADDIDRAGEAAIESLQGSARHSDCLRESGI